MVIHITSLRETLSQRKVFVYIILLMLALELQIIPVSAYSGQIVYQNLEPVTLGSVEASYWDLYDHSFTVQIKPVMSLYTLDHVFTETVKWDGAAISAAFLFGVEERLKYDHGGEEIRIVNLGIGCVFRGSKHEGTIGDTYWLEEYMLEDYQIHYYAYRYSYSISYTVIVEVEQKDEYLAAQKGWAEAQVGLSAELAPFIKLPLEFQAAVNWGVEYTVQYKTYRSGRYVYEVTYSFDYYRYEFPYECEVKVVRHFHVEGSDPLPIGMGETKIEPSAVIDEWESKKLLALGRVIYKTRIDFLTSANLGTTTGNLQDSTSLHVFSPP